MSGGAVEDRRVPSVSVANGLQAGCRRPSGTGAEPSPDLRACCGYLRVGTPAAPGMSPGSRKVSPSRQEVVGAVGGRHDHLRRALRWRLSVAAVSARTRKGPRETPGRGRGRGRRPGAVTVMPLLVSAHGLAPQVARPRAAEPGRVRACALRHLRRQGHDDAGLPRPPFGPAHHVPPVLEVSRQGLPAGEAVRLAHSRPRPPAPADDPDITAPRLRVGRAAAARATGSGARARALTTSGGATVRV